MAFNFLKSLQPFLRKNAEERSKDISTYIHTNTCTRTFPNFISIESEWLGTSKNTKLAKSDFLSKT